MDDPFFGILTDDLLLLDCKANILGCRSSLKQFTCFLSSYNNEIQKIRKETVCETCNTDVVPIQKTSVSWGGGPSTSCSSLNDHVTTAICDDKESAECPDPKQMIQPTNASSLEKKFTKVNKPNSIAPEVEEIQDINWSGDSFRRTLGTELRPDSILFKTYQRRDAIVFESEHVRSEGLIDSPSLILDVSESTTAASATHIGRSSLVDSEETGIDACKTTTHFERSSLVDEENTGTEACKTTTHIGRSSLVNALVSDLGVDPCMLITLDKGCQTRKFIKRKRKFTPYIRTKEVVR